MERQLRIWLAVVVGVAAGASHGSPSEAQTCRYECKGAETRNGRGCCIPAQRTGRGRTTSTTRKQLSKRARLKVPPGNAALVHIDSKAEKATQQGNYRQCGAIYAARFNDDQSSASRVQLAYNGALCFIRAKLVGRAVSLLKMVVRSHKTSSFAAHARLRLGRVMAGLGFHEGAAGHYEVYARTWPGAGDAADVWQDAIRFRVARGQTRKAVESGLLFAKTYQRYLPDRVADVVLSLTDLRVVGTNTELAEQHLQRYLKTYARKGGVDRRIVAHARLGAFLWNRSCSGAIRMGLCIKTTRTLSLGFTKTLKRLRRRQRSAKLKRLAIRKRCGSDSAVNVAVDTRDAKLVKLARHHFARAIRLWNNGRAVRSVHQNERVRTMNEWVAASRFFQIDRGFEQFLSLQFPTGLTFDRKDSAAFKASLKRFSHWVKTKKQAIRRLTRDYGTVGQYNASVWTTAAAVRLGQIAQSMAGSLASAPIPQSVRTGKYAEEKVDAYCDQLRLVADPFEKVAVRSFVRCLKDATRHKLENRWTAVCRRELGQLQPSKFPSAHELRATATFPGDFYDKPRRDDAQWKARSKANPMLTKPRLNLAWSGLRRLLSGTQAPNARTLVSNIVRHLTSVLAVDESNLRAYAMYALIYTHAADSNLARLEQARLFTDRGLRQPGNHAQLWNVRGRIAVLQDRLTAAETAFTRAVRLDTNHLAATVNLGLVKLAIRDAAGARLYFRRALKIRPKHTAAQVGLGIALRMQSNFLGAQKAFQSAIKSSPAHGHAYFNLGVLYRDFRAAGEAKLSKALALYKTARDCFKRSLSKQLTTPERNQVRQELKRIDLVITQLAQIVQVESELKKRSTKPRS